MYNKFLYSVATLVVGKFSKYIKQLITYVYNEYRILIYVRPIIKEYEISVYDFGNKKGIKKCKIKKEEQLMKLVNEIIAKYSIKREDIGKDDK